MPSDIDRIVSLLPSGTEILCALGLRDRIVGVSHECDFPADVTSLPRLTSSILDDGLSPAEIDAAVAAAGLEQTPLYAVDGALLESLAPDLIVTQGLCAVCAVTEDTIARSVRLATLDAHSRAPVLSLSGVNLAGIRRDILEVGRAAGVEAEAHALLARMEADWSALPGPGAHAPTVLMLEWPDPPWSGGHWVPEQVAAAGGVDLFGTAAASSERIQWDRVHEADPDLIIVMGCGFGLAENLEQARRLVRDPARQSLRAVRTGRVWAADANALFSRPGPRVVEGAALLARIFSGLPVSKAQAVPVTA